MQRLSFSTLASLDPAWRPRFEPRALGIGIVHLGLGAFQRAHQAIYTDEALAHAMDDWGICGVSLRSPAMRARLAAQDGLYTAVELGPRRTLRRLVGSVREVLFMGDESAAVRARLAAPSTRVVTLTITEKGYGHDPASGQLDFTNAGIAHDLAHPGVPASAVGLLVDALDARRRQGTPAFTVVCCDNLPRNGALLRGLVTTFAQARDPALAHWIERHARFPSTMVDRIVPATTQHDIETNDAALGLHDAAPVVFEPFRQWVIEDDFAGARPRWEAGGAELVADVAPYEAMKLRLLNASHSALAYLGFLAGHDYIYQVAAEPEFERFMRRLMDEARPTLALPATLDVAAYADALVSRFGNPALPHRTQQVAMDGSQKLPQRLLATVRENRAAGRPISAAALAVAAWMRYATGTDERGAAIAVADPLAARFASIAQAHGRDASRLAPAFLAIEAVFGRDLPADTGFIDAVSRYLGALFDHGAARTVALFNQSPRA